MTETALPPGSTLGVLGGGQLGRMMAQSAARMGYRVHVFCPDQDSPAAQVSPAVTVAPYDDRAALDTFVQSVDAVTLEFENVPVETAEYIAGSVPVRPGAHVLKVAQDRLLEKSLARDLGIRTPPFANIENPDDMRAALKDIGAPAVLKTRRDGYDGKGQRIIRPGDDGVAAFEELGEVPCLLEGFIDFALEISVIAVRDVHGGIVTYPAVENRHRDHILHYTIAPAAIAPETAEAARQAAEKLANALQVVGLLAVELFVTADGQIIFNEVAPRPHNSGHWTMEACTVSQYEQQVRATAGLPLGPTEPHHRAVMRNLIGDEANDWQNLLGGDRSLHLYGKGESRPGRKMGHVTRLYPVTGGNWPPTETELP